MRLAWQDAAGVDGTVWIAAAVVAFLLLTIGASWWLGRGRRR